MYKQYVDKSVFKPTFRHVLLYKNMLKTWQKHAKPSPDDAQIIPAKDIIFPKLMKCYRSENAYFLFIWRGFKTSGTFKNVVGDHIYHLAKYGLMGSDPDRFHER